MNKLFIILIISSLIITGCKSKKVNLSDKQLVSDCFTNYKTQVLAKNGEEAVKYIDSATVNYFGKLHYYAVAYDSTQIAQLIISEKFIVLSARAFFTGSDLQNMEHSRFLEQIISNNLLDNQMFTKVGLGKITVTDTLADGFIIYNNFPLPYAFLFKLENKTWLLNLNALIPLLQVQLKSILSSYNIPENEALLTYIGKITGKTCTNDIWQPIQ